MIQISNVDVFGFESAIRGMRNPMNSHDKSDSKWEYDIEDERELTELGESITQFFYKNKFNLGKNDLKLMKNLSKAGNDHAKFLRMIIVTVDITAPLYWWKEFDTYKVGTVANSCSTMHKIHVKEFTLDDFSHEHLTPLALSTLDRVVDMLNNYRADFTLTKMKEDWWQMIQLLPSSYNQKRTVQLNYQVLKSMYFARKQHKLDEWRSFCSWCETLPFFKEICIEV